MVNKILLIAMMVLSSQAQTLSKSLYAVKSLCYEQRIDLVKAEALLTDLFKNGPGEELRTAFSEIGLELSTVDAKRGVILLRASEETGEGLFYFRTAKHEEVMDMLSIPHRFFDMKTAPIGIRMFQQAPYRAAAFNTVHRDEVDMAHTPQTLFELFHKVYARVYPQESIYQLHGYSRQKRRSESASAAQIIVSSSSMNPSRKAEELVSNLADQEWSAALFPRDVNELGGTTNTTARMLLKSGYKGFIHIEMAPDLRRALASDKVMLKRFGGCLK